MLSKYSQLLQTDPVKTKMLTSGILFASGDLICQIFFSNSKGEPRPKINWRRFAKMTIVGAFVVSPFLHVWYGFVTRLIQTRFPKFTGLQKALASMTLDQTIFTLPFSFVLLFGLDYLDHFNLKRSLKTVMDIYPSYIVKNWMVWAPVMLINFLLIPEKYQVLFSDAVGFFWNIYLSFITNKGDNSNNQEINTTKKYV